MKERSPKKARAVSKQHGRESSRHKQLQLKMDDKDGGTAVSVMNDQQCGRANE